MPVTADGITIAPYPLICVGVGVGDIVGERGEKGGTDKAVAVGGGVGG